MAKETRDVFLIPRQRVLCQRIVQMICFLFVAPGAAVSQIPQQLCTSPIAIGGRIFIADIPENLPVGSTIGNLQLQGSAQEISIRYPEPHNPNVEVDPISQNLTVKAPLDKEDYDFIDIHVECVVLAQGFEIPVPIKITILDVNDNPPRFLGEPYTTTISELMPIGTTVMSGISASDPDADNWKITFEILDDGPFASYFTFPIETSGNLVLVKPLDYEAVHSIELHIVAKDHHPAVLGRPQPQLNTTAVATVQLYDGDDQNPAFTSPSYLAYVTENAPVGTILTINPLLFAYDQDFGLNATLSYTLVKDSIYDPPRSSYFSMDNATGMLSLVNDVLRRGEQFFINVKATQVDNADRFAMTSLYILVQAANENQPRFLQDMYKVTLVENVPTGSYVTTVSAIDNDDDDSNSKGPDAKMSLPADAEFTELKYSFTNPLLVTDFVINSKSGVINTRQGLSYERTPVYNISVSVTDGKWFDYTRLVVALLNINNHSPVFGEKLYDFQGHKEPNFYVGKVEATDSDAGSILRYSSAENSSHFSLRPNGEIYIVGDVSTIPDDDVHSLFIVAEDEGAPPRKDVTVARVTFGAGTGAVTAAGQTDLVVIIILGVLAGALLLIIVVLSIYIHRNSQHPPPSPAHSQAYTTEVDPIDAYFESSKSFERGINELPNGYANSYMDPTEGVYKPTTRDRHLALYHDINMERDATTIQESPFEMDTESSPNTSYTQSQSQSLPRGSVDGRRSYGGYSAHSLKRSDPSSSVYSVPHDPRMQAVNEIDYNTSIAPMDNVSSATVGRTLDYSPPSDSDAHFRGSAGSLSTFKVGNSTQALVPPHSPDSSSVGYRGKGSSVSFIDDHQINVYHPDNAINPATGSTGREKPEITVYY